MGLNNLAQQFLLINHVTNHLTQTREAVQPRTQPACHGLQYTATCPNLQVGLAWYRPNLLRSMQMRTAQQAAQVSWWYFKRWRKTEDLDTGWWR